MLNTFSFGCFQIYQDKRAKPSDIKSPVPLTPRSFCNVIENANLPVENIIYDMNAKTTAKLP